MNLETELELLKASNKELVMLVKKMTHKLDAINATIISYYEKPKEFTEKSFTEIKVKKVVKSNEELKDLLLSEKWPTAASSESICGDNELQKRKRAKAIVDSVISQNIENKNLLDYGCGEGYTINYAKSKTKAIGYDIQKSGNLWDSLSNLTTDYATVQKNSPYDIILLYDVLDHAENPIEIMKNAESLLSEKGTIYVRCHPWFSRHGGHLYTTLNKAFINVVFSDDELKTMNLVPPVVTIRKINEYNNIFTQAKLKTRIQLPIRSPVEGFFKQGIIAERISERLNGDELNIGVNFIDYQLEKSDQLPVNL